MKGTLALLLLAFIALVIFGMPYALIYSVRELFGLEWGDKYWAVFWLMSSVGYVFGNFNRGSNS